MTSSNEYLRLHQYDNVLIAIAALSAGKLVEGIPCVDDVPAGHKVAASHIAKDQAVI